MVTIRKRREDALSSEQMRFAVRLQLLGWIAVAAVDFALSKAAYPDDELSWALFASVSLALIGFVSSSLLLLIYKRWLPERRSAWTLPLASGCVLAAAGLYAIVTFSESAVGYPYSSGFLQGLFGKGVLCLVIMTAWHGIFAGIKAAGQALQAERLASEARLMALRYQLSPHFLFNTLNSAIALIDESPPRAQRMLELLSRLLRATLESESVVDTTLSEELEIIGRYIEIQKIRFEEKLVVTVEVSEEAGLCLIPPLLLHTLVENAVKHGFRTSESRPLHIEINADVVRENLGMVVVNSGSLKSGSLSDTNVDASAGAGVGVENVRSRLDVAYPGQYAFSLAEKNGVVTARVRISSPRVR